MICPELIRSKAKLLYKKLIITPSPIPNKLKPKHKNKNVVNLGLKLRGFSELHETFGIFFIVKNIFLTIIYTFLN